jgi:hypothetical protein
MAGEVKNVEAGETRKFEHGMVQIVKVGSVTLGRARFEPGWRWSNDVKPIAETESCTVHHTGYGISGRLHVAMNDGSEFEIGPGDAHDIQPGHDAWVVGDEPYIGVDFSEEVAGFAKPAS